jgi:hypothetical protein
MLSKMKNCSKCGSTWLGLDDVKRSAPTGTTYNTVKKSTIRVVVGQIALCRSCGYKTPETRDVVSAIKIWNQFN